MAKQPRVWTGTQWDTLAVTLPDLSNYSTTTQMNTAIDNAKGLVYITGSTFTTASAVNFNSVFSSTYTNYRVVCEILTSVNGGSILFRYRSSGSDNATSNYFNQSYRVAGTTAYATSNNSDTSFTLVWSEGTTHAPISLDVINPNSSTKKKSIIGLCFGRNSGDTTFIGGMIGGIFNTTTQFDGFSILPGSGTLTGSIKVYGYKE